MRDKITNTNNNLNRIKGLTSQEVNQRILDGKVNFIPKVPSRTIGQILRANIFTFFNGLNAVLALVVILAGSPKNALFAGVIFMNTLIGVLQELRAKSIIEKLSLLNTSNITVIRDNKEIEIPIDNLVIDDIMLLTPGTKIAVDGIMIEDNNLEVDESLLTGETDPVLKNNSSKVLSGSYVISGSGYAKVTDVGTDTYAAKLAEEAKRFKLINSELQSAVQKILKLLTKIIIPTSILLVITQIIFNDATWQESAIAVTSGIIGMVPEGFVLLTSTTLIVAIIKLSKWNVLIQELPATEVLARVDTLCLDKTGTLTVGNLKFSHLKLLDDSNESFIETILSSVVHAVPTINPTQRAIMDKFPLKNSLKVKNTIPFSSATKWSAVEFEKEGAYVLGAPEMILGNKYSAIKKEVDNEAKLGRRVLLLAQVNEEKLLNNLLEDVKGKALIFIEDIIRKEAPTTLKYFSKEGVNIKVISGDNPLTVAAIAKKAGVKDADKCIDASTLPDDLDALADIMENNSVFGRVTPHQKQQMVKALHSKNHVVAMTGDGVNDVLALKESDCGIAMASGSDATKAVAQLILLNSDFSVLPRVVAEGRKLINNLEKVSELYLSKTVYSIIMCLILGVLLVPYVILPIHISLIGSLAIGIPSLFFAITPNTERVQKNYLKRILSTSIPNGIIISIFTLIPYLFCYYSGMDLESSRTIAVLILGSLSLIILLKVAKPISALKLGIVIIMASLFILAFLIPLGREFFSLVMIKNLILPLIVVAISFPIINALPFILKTHKKAIRI